MLYLHSECKSVLYAGLLKFADNSAIVSLLYSNKHDHSPVVSVFRVVQITLLHNQCGFNVDQTFMRMF